MRRKRLLWALPHTLGANDVFVAFALAAAGARRLGLTNELSQWTVQPACERRRCKPDGYGLYRREGVSNGFLLEYDAVPNRPASTPGNSAPTIATTTAGRPRGTSAPADCQATARGRSQSAQTRRFVRATRRSSRSPTSTSSRS
ncbi:MAG: replication-relaxation family protein [Chloroflexi bacterium]|nr:replication-relaxation family protein [Chloroflexota bacterium]MBV9597316.1 replication-relaxation family protein [Chloroflexota bacterium]